VCVDAAADADAGVEVAAYPSQIPASQATANVKIFTGLAVHHILIP